MVLNMKIVSISRVSQGTYLFLSGAGAEHIIKGEVVVALVEVDEDVIGARDFHTLPATCGKQEIWG